MNSFCIIVQRGENKPATALTACSRRKDGCVVGEVGSYEVGQQVDLCLVGEAVSLPRHPDSADMCPQIPRPIARQDRENGGTKKRAWKRNAKDKRGGMKEGGKKVSISVATGHRKRGEREITWSTRRERIV